MYLSINTYDNNKREANRMLYSITFLSKFEFKVKFLRYFLNVFSSRIFWLHIMI